MEIVWMSVQCFCLATLSSSSYLRRMPSLPSLPIPSYLKSNQSWSKLTPLWDGESLQLMDKKTSPLGPIFYTSREINSSRTWDNFVFNILAGGSALINCVKLNIQFIDKVGFQQRFQSTINNYQLSWNLNCLGNHLIPPTHLPTLTLPWYFWAPCDQLPLDSPQPQLHPNNFDFVIIAISAG